MPRAIEACYRRRRHTQSERRRDDHDERGLQEPPRDEFPSDVQEIDRIGNLGEE